MTEVPARRRRTGAVVAVTAATLVVVALAIAAVVVFNSRGDRGRPAAGPATAPTTAGPAGTTPDQRTPTTTAPTATAPAPPPPRTTPTNCTDCAMQDGVTYNVGVKGPHGARAGQYHSDGPVAANGTCSWTLVVGADLREKTLFGPTDVLVRTGASFTSRGCRTWHLTVPA